LGAWSLLKIFFAVTYATIFKIHVALSSGRLGAVVKIADINGSADISFSRLWRHLRDT
jgi:hypothetical protein